MHVLHWLDEQYQNVSKYGRVHTTVPQERTNHLAVTYHMLTTRQAFTLESTLVEQMGRLCLVRYCYVTFIDTCNFSFLILCGIFPPLPNCLIGRTLSLSVQWEYQVGPSVGIEAGDHIWISRYLLEVLQIVIKDFLIACHLCSFLFPLY